MQLAVVAELSSAGRREVDAAETKIGRVAWMHAFAVGAHEEPGLVLQPVERAWLAPVQQEASDLQRFLRACG